MKYNGCQGCCHYLGGSQCRINAERECADDDYQLWEEVSHERDRYDDYPERD